MKKFFVHIVFLLLAQILWAQQKPIPTQYVYDKYFINPAYAGSSNFFTASMTVKQQLLGFEGAPKTQYFMSQLPMQAQFMGVGIKLMHDQIGVATQNNVLVSYAYQIGLAGGALSMSLEGGLYNSTAKFSQLIIADDDPDAAIPLNNESVTVPDASFGMFYKFEKLYVGYSVFHLLGGNLKYASTGYEGGEVLSKYHYIVSGFNYKLNKQMTLEPMILGKIGQASPLQIDISTQIHYKKLASAGLLYSSGNGIAAMFQLGLKEGQYKLGYSYDLTFPKLQSYAKGGHEIMFIYSLELTPPASQKDFNPIYYVK